MEKLLKLIKDLTWYNKVEKSKEILRLLTTVFLQDAPEDGNIYGRKDGAWEEVTTGGVVSDASPTVKGISKLYNDLLASNTDGSVTQAALVAYLADVLEQDYSTDEVDTGVKWIDGKPIYRISTSGSHNAYDGNEDVILSIPNLKNIIQSFSEMETNGEYLYGLTGCYNSNNVFMNRVGSDDIYLFNTFGAPSYDVPTHYTLTIEYTKTTD